MGVFSRSSWLNSTSAQIGIIALIMFTCPGMNGTVFGLGAGGSRAEMIPLVDKISATGLSITAATAMFGGSVTTKHGPRFAMLVATCGYPTFIAALWLLDKGQARWFAWVSAIWHGISTAVFYPAAGFVVTAYSPESHRGRYIASMWCSQGFGSVVGAAIILGITSNTHRRTGGVPTTVYATVVGIQILGVVFSLFLVPPSEIHRENGRRIAHFAGISWKEELISIPKTICRPETLLLAVGLFSCGMPFSFYSSFNGSYFSARTRALTNLCYHTTYFSGTLFAAFAYDSPRLGPRRRRAISLNVISLLINIATWSGMIYFLTTNAFDRKRLPPKVDWTDRAQFVKLLLLFIALGLSHSLYQFYHIWVCSTLSNEPRKLGRLNGYISALRLTGLAVSYGLDSHKVGFLVEAKTYFTLLTLGGFLSLMAAYKYVTDTNSGKEDSVITPEESAMDSVRSTDSGSDASETVYPVQSVKGELQIVRRPADLETGDWKYPHWRPP